MYKQIFNNYNSINNFLDVSTSIMFVFTVLSIILLIKMCSSRSYLAFTLLTYNILLLVSVIFFIFGFNQFIGFLLVVEISSLSFIILVYSMFKSNIVQKKKELLFLFFFMIFLLCFNICLYEYKYVYNNSFFFKNFNNYNVNNLVSLFIVFFFNRNIYIFFIILCFFIITYTIIRFYKNESFGVNVELAYYEVKYYYHTFWKKLGLDFWDSSFASNSKDDYDPFANGDILKSPFLSDQIKLDIKNYHRERMFRESNKNVENLNIKKDLNLKKKK